MSGRLPAPRHRLGKGACAAPPRLSSLRALLGSAGRLTEGWRMEGMMTRRLGSMSRRTMLGAGAGALAGTLAAPAVVRAQAPLQWKMATSWPKNTPGVGVNAQRCADMITAMSGGRIEIRFFAAGELVPPFEVFDAVSGGTVELGHGSPYYWQGKDQSFHFFSGVP